HAVVRVLPHIKKLEDCFGQFLVRVMCDCAACREIEPEALARLVGWKVTLKQLALRMRCSKCGKKAAEVVAVARPRPRGCRRIRTGHRLTTLCRKHGPACERHHPGARLAILWLMITSAASPVRLTYANQGESRVTRLELRHYRRRANLRMACNT